MPDLVRQQEQATINRLNALIGGAKCKGYNLGPKPVVKTKESIEAGLRNQKQKYIDPENAFDPLKARKKRMPMDEGAVLLSKKRVAVPVEHMMPDFNPHYPNDTRRLPGAPRDPNTVSQAMHYCEALERWDGAGDGTTPRPRTGRRVFPDKQMSKAEDQYRLLGQDVEELTPHHSATVMRFMSMEHPKFRRETAIDHSQKRWNEMSQLLSHQFTERPVNKARAAAQAKEAAQREAAAAKRKNPIRMMVHLRSQSAKARAWH